MHGVSHSDDFSIFKRSLKFNQNIISGYIISSLTKYSFIYVHDEIFSLSLYVCMHIYSVYIVYIVCI